MIPSRRVLTAIAMASLIGAAASAAPAGAATVVVPPCVVDYGGSPAIPSIPIGGTGWTPNGGVNIQYASKANTTPQLLGSTGTDGAGNIVDVNGNIGAHAFPIPFKSASTNQQTFYLAVADAVNPAITAATQFQQVRFGLTANPSKAHATRKVHYSAGGFTPGVSIYMHFRYHGKTKRNLRLGKAKAPCGTAKRKLRLLPTKVRYGTWKVYVDQSKTFKANTVIQAVDQITITRVFS
jgi:hypothetical protein